MQMMDELTRKIKESGSMLCIELDGDMSSIPIDYINKLDVGNNQWKNPKGNPDTILKFNKDVIDLISSYVGVVSVPMVSYLKHGEEGISVYIQTIIYAKTCGLMVIGDINAGDMPHRMEEYSHMFIGKRIIDDFKFTAEYDSDFVTFNPFYGLESFRPIAEDMKQNNRGAFATIMLPGLHNDLVDINNLKICGGDNIMRPMYMELIRQVRLWNTVTTGGQHGDNGYMPVGIMMNLCNQSQEKKVKIISEVRKTHPDLFLFLMNHSCEDNAHDLCYPAQAALNKTDNTGVLVGIGSRMLFTCMYYIYPGMEWKQAVKQLIKDSNELLNL